MGSLDVQGLNSHQVSGSRCKKQNFNRRGKSRLLFTGTKEKGRETRSHKNFSEGEHIFKDGGSESQPQKMPAAAQYDSMVRK